MGRSLKKGPFIDPKLLKKIELMNERGDKKVIRAHDCCTRRPPACADLCD